MDSFAEDVAAVGRIDTVATILDVICRSTGMGFAAVARVTEDRWIACAVHDDIQFGLKPGGELDVRTTICNEIRGSGEMVVIDHVAEDPAFVAHHTPLQYGFQSYISVPLRLRDGSFFGTLCAIDPRPARLKTPQVIGMFTLFADLIAFHLDAQIRLAHSEQALLTERETAELREQFIAVLGHDLRNPLTAIAGSTSLLLRENLSEEAKSIVGIMQDSVRRMRGMIGNVLDFARGRLGGGIAVNRTLTERLGRTLEQVVAEQRAARPDREIRTDFQLDEAVLCDGPRVAQLFSNLLGNALTHGAVNEAVIVQARSRAPGLVLSVANRGPAIPAETMARLFQPYYRGRVMPAVEQDETPDYRGLGLGLYIASEIARAHGGTLDVTSSDAETCFTFRIPA